MRLGTEYTRLQTRLETMYVDNLNGRITPEYFDRKAEEWRSEQSRIRRAIEEHEAADRSYMEEGVRLLDLCAEAPQLFERQDGFMKRKMLNLVLSNSIWKDGRLTAEYRPPFDLVALMAASAPSGDPAAWADSERCTVWRGRVDSYKTRLIAPTWEITAVLDEAKELRAVGGAA